MVSAAAETAIHVIIMETFKLNENFFKIPESYLFSEVAARVAAYKAENPEADIISLGIGDVTRPNAPSVIAAMHEAVEEMSTAEGFHGYGPEQGYMFLREAIALHDYEERGVHVSPDEIFISDGAKSDLANIGDIFSAQCRVAVTDPVYPVYVDTNVMGGRAGRLSSCRWDRIEYLPCTEENAFIPSLPSRCPDLIYLCYPNNPTGTVLSRSELAKWVDYAIENQCVILFDSAYESFISTPGVPHSIYEVPGARKVAIEFRSFSKRAGFTGLRCGYTVVPEELRLPASDGKMHSLRKMWLRRQSTKFNGASYVIQRGAAAVYTRGGLEETSRQTAGYKENAALLLRACRSAGLEVEGGVDAPYVWVCCPEGYGSWDFFSLLLTRLHIVSTPGCGFGPAGEGYVRLTAFNTPEATREAAARLSALKNC